MRRRKVKKRSHSVRIRIPVPEDRLLNLPPELRGPPQNKYGGYQLQRLRGFKGGTYGAANKGRSLTAEERQAWADQNLPKKPDKP